jgi:hypothetical protein
MLGRPLTVLGALAVLGIGGAALLWPRQATRTYGVPTDEQDVVPYVRATAARDLTMGGFVLWAALANDRPAMEAGLLSCTLAPLADFVIVLRHRGWTPQLAIHASGVAGVALTWLLVRSID